MAPARLNESEAGIGDQRRNGPAQKVRWRNEIGVENRYKRCVGMIEAESKIAGLEAGALAAAQHGEVDAVRHALARGFAQFLMRFGLTIVQKLDLKPVARPVEPRRSLGNAQCQRALVAYRKLDQNVREEGIGQCRRSKGARRPEPAQDAQTQQL